jgi:outer membrane protein assembly factor BamA
VILVGQIFDLEDPKENRGPFRVANRLHRRTREEVIRRQLPFHSGDPYSATAIQEAGRILRSNHYFHDAEVCATQVRGDEVDVAVVTRDVWTLIPSFSFGRKGGANSYTFKIKDRNFLGTGKDLAAESSTTVDRTVTSLLYRDPNLLGSRNVLDLELENNSDGAARRLALERPFYSLDARWTAGVQAAVEDRTDPLYEAGKIQAQFHHNIEAATLFWGRSTGLNNGWVRRWTVGFTHDQHRFETAEVGPPPEALPPELTLDYPWFAFELLQNQFVEVQQLTLLGRTEDFQLGWALRGQVGWSAQGLGATEDQLVTNLTAHKGWRPREDVLLLTQGSFNGRWGGRTETQRTKLGASLFWRDIGEHVFYVHAEADRVRNLDHGEQLLLGGDSGLRGYPLRYQDGDRRFLLTLEQRFYSPWNLFQLVQVGGAVFFDIGRSWFPDEASGPTSGTLKDVGLGLRLSPSRSGRGALVHVDIAFPLDGDPALQSTQFLVSTHETF